MAPSYLKWTPTSSSTLVIGYLDMEFFHILVLRDNESLQTLCKKIVREPKGLRSHFLLLLLLGQVGTKREGGKKWGGTPGQGVLAWRPACQWSPPCKADNIPKPMNHPSPPHQTYSTCFDVRASICRSHCIYRHICFPNNLNAFSGFNWTGDASRRRSPHLTGECSRVPLLATLFPTMSMCRWKIQFGGCPF